MIVLDTSLPTSSPYFVINNIPYQKGMYRVLTHGDNVGIFEVGDVNVQIVDERHFSEWEDENNIPYATKADLINALLNHLFIEESNIKNFQYISSNTASNHSQEYYYVDASSNPVNLTFEGSPANGSFKEIFVGSNQQTITIDGNGSDINGQPTYVIPGTAGGGDDASRRLIVVVYDATKGEWVLAGGQDAKNVTFDPTVVAGTFPVDPTNVQSAVDSLYTWADGVLSGRRLLGFLQAGATYTDPAPPTGGYLQGDYYIQSGDGPLTGSTLFPPSLITNGENGDWLFLESVSPDVWKRFRPTPIRKPIDFFDPTKQYYYGDFVYSSGDLYVNVTGNLPAGPFDPSQWTNVSNNSGTQAKFNAVDFVVTNGESGLTHFVDTNANPIDITLPGTPTLGEYIVFLVYGPNGITIQGGGNDILDGRDNTTNANLSLTTEQNETQVTVAYDGTKWIAWVLQAGAGGGGGDGSPIGTIVTFPSLTPPDGYLLCDGNTFPAASYPELNVLLNGNTTPDLRDQFIRGSSTQSQINGFQKRQDTTRKPRTNFTGVTNTTGNHRHEQGYKTTGTSYYVYGHRHLGSVGGVSSNDSNNYAQDLPYTNTTGNHSHTVTINSGGDAETAPKHVHMAFHIKARNNNAKLTTLNINPVTVADAAPAKLAEGQMWFNTSNGKYYIVENTAPAGDPVNYVWIQVNNY